MGLVIASAGITAPGRSLLRAVTGLWPAFAVLRDGQQFVAPLALAEALGFGLVVAWAPPRAPTARPAQGDPARAGGYRPRADRPGLVIAAAALLAPYCCCPGWRGERPGRCARSGTRPAGWPRPPDRRQPRLRGDVLLLPWAAVPAPGLERWPDHAGPVAAAAIAAR